MNAGPNNIALLYALNSALVLLAAPLLALLACGVVVMAWKPAVPGSPGIRLATCVALMLVVRGLLVPMLPAAGASDSPGATAQWAVLEALLALPAAVLIVGAAVRAVPASIVDAARCDNGSSVVLLTQIVIPLVRPAIAMTWFVAAVPAWSDRWMPWTLAHPAARAAWLGGMILTGLLVCAVGLLLTGGVISARPTAGVKV